MKVIVIEPERGGLLLNYFLNVRKFLNTEQKETSRPLEYDRTQMEYGQLRFFLASYNDHMNDSYSERLEFSFWSVTTIYPTNKKAYSGLTIPFLRDILFSKILLFPFELIPSLIHCNFQISTIPNVAGSQGQNHSEIIASIRSAVNNEHLLYVYIRRKVHSLGI